MLAKASARVAAQMRRAKAECSSERKSRPGKGRPIVSEPVVLQRIRNLYGRPRILSRVKVTGHASPPISSFFPIPRNRLAFRAPENPQNLLAFSHACLYKVRYSGWPSACLG